MADFYFNGQKFDHELVAAISSRLDSVGVPNILWDNYLLTVYGVPTIVDSIAFVIPDKLLTVAYSALLNTGFLPCALGTGCIYSSMRYRPTPSSHLHITEERVVSLYQKSQTLLIFPDFDKMLHDAGNPYIMHASDPQLPSASPGRGAGRFSSSLHPVRIPTAIKYCEAVIHLLCRDRGSAYEGYWVVLLTYIMEYVDGTSIFNEEALAQPYQRLYHAIKHGDLKMYLILDEIRYELMGLTNDTAAEK
ncbi:hypothetical protein DTO217A2_7800 [Paecilomyces variotii]|nr:hypothetical protein DTO217A2_7800 [Paecilomyces variotii]KAJ9367241.1 hypothetical protein DTO282E5_8089 [Paecilomyces variotii]